MSHRTKTPTSYLQDRPVLGTWQRRLLWLLAPPAIALCCAVLAVSGRLDRFELMTVDDRFVRRGSLEPDPRIVVVEINEAGRRELKADGEQFNLRHYLDDAIEALADAGAIAIGVDVILEGRGDEQTDARLADVMSATNVVLATTYVESKNHRPADVFREAAVAEAQVNVEPDPDGTLRRIPLHPNRGMAVLEGMELEQFPHFPFVMAWMALSEQDYAAGREPKPADFSQQGRVTIMGRTVEYGRLVNFAAGPDRGFVTFSLADAVNRRFDAGKVNGSVVLIGDGRSIVDQFRMPLSNRMWPGVYYHANVVDQILQDRALVEWPTSRSGLFWLTAAITAVAGWYFWNLRDWWRRRAGWAWLTFDFVAGAVVFGGGWYIGCHLAFDRNIVLPMAGPLFGIAATMLTGLGMQAAVTVMNARRLSERNRQIESLFGRSVSAAVLDAIKADPQRVARTEVRQATVLFSDIRGFTAVSSKLSPQQVADLLNEYFDAVTSAVFENDGFLDKFVGDELMAVFGVPLDQPDHALRAARTALDIKRRLAELNERRASRGDRPLDCGVGIHSGPVAAGHIGTAQRANYTVVGDTVNMTARIEGLTRKGEILISEQASQMLDGALPVREWSTVELRGSDRMHKLYEVLPEQAAPARSEEGPMATARPST